MQRQYLYWATKRFLLNAFQFIAINPAAGRCIMRDTETYVYVLSDGLIKFIHESVSVTVKKGHRV